MVTVDGGSIPSLNTPVFGEGPVTYQAMEFAGELCSIPFISPENGFKTRCTITGVFCCDHDGVILFQKASGFIKGNIHMGEIG